MKYGIKNHFNREGAVNPEVAARSLEAIRLAHGGVLTPKVVVKEARNPKHPLHKWFTWDDGVAAERWRLTQATSLIHAVVITGDGEGEEPHRFYGNVGEKGDRAYVTMADAMDDADMRAQLIEEARQGLDRWSKRYGQIKEFTEVTKVIKKTLKAAKPVKARRSKAA